VSNFKGDDTDAAWSPDGNWIAYVNQGRFTDVRQIYISRPDGGNRNRISLDYEEYSPVWSPDMNWLFYVVLARDHNYFWYRNKTADYATPQPYDPSSFFGRLGEVADPAFSPDGSLIAYTKLEASYKMIFSMEFESRGGKTSQMTENRQVNYQPVWSPDAQWIAFSSERDGNPEIYLMTSAGLMQTNLTNADGINMQPTWQH
jgi:TolB protein